LAIELNEAKIVADEDILTARSQQLNEKSEEYTTIERNTV
jgi:hypothetical protein